MNNVVDDQAPARLVPFVKWAGGKRWLWPRFQKLFPLKFNTYFEPFLGSGSIFWALEPAVSTLSDANEELIDTYCAIRDEWKAVRSAIQRHANNHSDEYYYTVRASRPRSPSGRAARMLYLNRTCWNGLYRVNTRGIFNVPRGTKDSVMLASDNFREWSRRLETATILCRDFQDVLDQAKEGDFVFIDPPYTTAHNLNGFVKYNDKIFTWHDQIRLRDAVLRAYHRGAKVLVLNANHESIKRAYEGVGVHQELSRASVISGVEKGRHQTTELAIVFGYRVDDTLA